MGPTRTAHVPPIGRLLRRFIPHVLSRRRIPNGAADALLGVAQLPSPSGGELGPLEFWISTEQFEVWRHTRLIIDAIPGRGGGFPGSAHGQKVSHAQRTLHRAAGRVRPVRTQHAPCRSTTARPPFTRRPWVIHALHEKFMREHAGITLCPLIHRASLARLATVFSACSHIPREPAV